MPRFLDGQGFVDALLDPPYGLSPRTDGQFSRALDEDALLRDVIHDVLHTPTADTPIWHWEGWCRYFEAGWDWWGGSGMDGPHRTGPDDIVSIAASSTD